MNSSYLKISSAPGFLGLIAGLVLVLAVQTSVPVAAYPPGQNLTITVNRNQVMVNQLVKVKVSNPAPGELEVAFGDRTKRAQVAAGQEFVVFRFTPKTRTVYSLVATDSVGDVAYGKVYVPYATAPRTVSAGQQFVVRVERAKPGSPAAIYVDNRSWLTVVRPDGTAKFKIKINRKTTHSLTILVGKTITNRRVTVL